MGKLVSHSSVSDFLACNRDYLLKREAQNNLILGICENLKQKPLPPQAELLSVIYRNEPVAVLIKTGSKAIISATTYTEGDIKLLSAYFDAQNEKPAGILGETLYADLFARNINLVGRVKSRLMLQQLSSIPESRDSFQKFLPAEESQLTKLAEFLVAYAFETEHESRLSMESAYEIVKHQQAENRLFVWNDAGVVVSMGAILRETPGYCAIGNIYTPPGSRGKGFGRNCATELSRHVFAKGFKGSLLFSDLSNPVSGHIYKEIGYVPVSEFCDIAFNQQA